MALSREQYELLLEIQNLRRIEEPKPDYNLLPTNGPIVITSPDKTPNGECWYCGTKRAMVYHGIMCDDCYKGMYGNE